MFRQDPVDVGNRRGRYLGTQAMRAFRLRRYGHALNNARSAAK
jgi:hypothetical protein